MSRMQAAILALAMLAAPPAATAGASDWVEAEGGRVRLILATPLPDKPIRAALEIELSPGWKTYWRDPGDAGVPPTVAAIPGSPFQIGELRFPAPERMDDGFSIWAGYSRSVTLPFEVTGGLNGDLTVDAFLGICETICVPLKARLTIDGDTLREDDPAATQAVEAAFAALPGAPGEGQGVELLEAGEKHLTVKVTPPAESMDTPELFVAGEGGVMLGTPSARDAGAGIYDVPIVARPRKGHGPVSLPYVVVTGASVFSGNLELPAMAP